MNVLKAEGDDVTRAMSKGGCYVQGGVLYSKSCIRAWESCGDGPGTELDKDWSSFSIAFSLNASSATRVILRFPLVLALLNTSATASGGYIEFWFGSVGKTYSKVSL